MTGPAVLRIASVNMNYGGIDADGSKDRWHTLTGFLREQEPDILLCQEMAAARPSGLDRHLRETARSLGMTPAAVGPPAPGAASGSEHHTAVLVRPWLEVIEAGPAAAYRPWDHVPWAEALLLVPGLPFLLRVYSVHQVLAGIGLTDIAAGLPPQRRDPPDLSPTGTAGGRVDRGYALSDLASAVTAWRQVRTAATDHDVHVFTISLAQAAAMSAEPG